ncbi:MAG TPA: hypothetical protein VHB50_11135 [Bryobacteraceae bacterium]|nr:hypothetical protein [Bryobacteraceae bacterium]
MDLNSFAIGVDLGQRRDHTAIAVVERDTRDVVMVRHVERVPLGTSYPRVVERVREIALSERLAGRCSVAVDATGVGAPVVEMLRAARLGCEVAAVTITGGERETQTVVGWNVPKRDLIAGVQVLLESGDLRISGGLRELRALTREMVDVRITPRPGRFGGEGVGAERAGEHDDLVLALALGVWKLGRVKGRIGFVGRRLVGVY